MSELKNKIYIVLGDWSDDGHGKYEKYLIAMNKTKLEMQEAYKESSKKLGISFDCNDEYLEVEREYDEREKYQIACAWEDSTLSEECIKILTDAGAPIAKVVKEYNGCLGKDEFVDLLMWFIGYSLEGFKWAKIAEPIETFNGYWDKNLNISLGYGLF